MEGSWQQLKQQARCVNINLLVYRQRQECRSTGTREIVGQREVWNSRIWQTSGKDGQNSFILDSMTTLDVSHRILKSYASPKMLSEFLQLLPFEFMQLKAGRVFVFVHVVHDSCACMCDLLIAGGSSKVQKGLKIPVLTGAKQGGSEIVCFDGSHVCVNCRPILKLSLCAAEPSSRPAAAINLLLA